MSKTTLRNGYTTGTCATAASQAAGIFLLHKEKPHTISLELPCGECAHLTVEYYRTTENGALAAVRKDAGDDPDITHGCIIETEVCFTPTPVGEMPTVTFIAGSGVGTITRPGLQLPPGNAAINPVPRQMITDALLNLSTGNWTVTIHVPQGEELAKKTFNPKLGIEGGISIIGTSGIVRPFSHEALAETVRCNLRVLAAENVSNPILVAGHYGETAAKIIYPDNPNVVSVSNCWDIALREAAILGFKKLLIVGHPGKLAKFCTGHFDTHSKNSPSALPCVTQLADELHIPHGATEDLSQPMSNEDSDRNPATVEGFFALLSGKASKTLGNSLADRCAHAANKYSSLPVELTLINMAKNILGSSISNCGK